MDRVELLRRLIAQEEDEAELKRLNDELVKAIEEDAAAKARTEADKEIVTLKGQLDLITAKAKSRGLEIGDNSHLEISEVFERFTSASSGSPSADVISVL